MNVIHSLKHAFLVALGSFSLSHAQGGVSNDNKDSIHQTVVTPAPTSVVDTNAAVQQAKFDYAFGDQTAASLHLPGSTGTGWGVRDTFQALKKFLEKNPGALKGKNVFVAIGDGGAFETFWTGPKLADLMQEAVGNGKIVLMGLSETRTDIDGADANKLLIKEAAKRKIIYGGPLLNATSNNNIYPVTPEAFKASTDQARAKLENELNAIKVKKPAPATVSPRN